MLSRRAIAIGAAVAVALIVIIVIWSKSSSVAPPEPTPSPTTPAPSPDTTTTTTPAPTEAPTTTTTTTTTPKPGSEPGATRSKLFEFTRCDGSDEPLGQIKISACPDTKDLEHCIMERGSSVTFEFDFIPPRDLEKLTFGMRAGRAYKFVDACAASSGLKCPMEAHVKQHLKQVVQLPNNLRNFTGMAKFYLFEGQEFDNKMSFCVAFPVRIN